MTSIRSISNSRTNDRLLNRRFARTSASTTTGVPRQIALPKTGSVKASSSNSQNGMNSRLKSNRLCSHHNSLTSIVSTSPQPNGHVVLTAKQSLEYLKPTHMTDLPPLRPPSRSSDVGAIALSTKQMTVDDEQQKERHELIAQPFPSAEFQQFTIESVDVIRTIGTGKSFDMT